MSHLKKINNSKLKIISLILIAFFVVLPQAFAASSSFFESAHTYYSKTCMKSTKINDISAVLCYAFDKLGEQDQKINALENRVKELEDNTLPLPTDHIFFNDEYVSTGGTTSATFDAKGYTNLAFSFHCTEGSAQINLMVSPDGTNWVNQYSASPEQCSAGGNINLTVSGRYYAVSMNSTTLPSLKVFASGHFFYNFPH